MLDTEMPSGPGVLVDAEAQGKAVIATDVDGTWDYIEYGVTGWLVPAHDPDALAEQIRAVIRDEQTLLKGDRAARLATLDMQAVLGVLRGPMVVRLDPSLFPAPQAMPAFCDQPGRDQPATRTDLALRHGLSPTLHEVSLMSHGESRAHCQSGPSRSVILAE